MKSLNKFYFALLIIFSFNSCEKINEGINENPNDLRVEEVEENLFLTGGMIANIQVQCGHLNRISAMYSGQLIGFSSLYSNIYGFNLSTAESNGEWNAIYVGVLTNMRHIINNTNIELLKGIAMVIEAHAVGTAASLFGDIPYSEAGNPDIADPSFDNQIEVYSAVINLLNEGIAIIEQANQISIPQDIHFEGDKNKWIAVANTLKARYYLQQKDYVNAFAAAQNGISSADGDMKFFPRNGATDDKNLFWTILEGSRGGDIGNNDNEKESYLLSLLSTRTNIKTNETARKAFYTINSSRGSANSGIIEEKQPQNMVTFFENKLILAETAARAGEISDGLPHLNDVRLWLNEGGNLNINFIGMPYQYDPYITTDFAEGGIENIDNIDPKTAFLREVIEERYISGFGMHIPFNDARRLRKSDGAIAVSYSLVDGPNPPYPERMPYASNELNSNSNAPDEDPGIFQKTAVNQ
jgi:hypothetical protein